MKRKMPPLSTFQPVGYTVQWGTFVLKQETPDDLNPEEHTIIEIIPPKADFTIWAKVVIKTLGETKAKLKKKNYKVTLRSEDFETSKEK